MAEATGKYGYLAFYKGKRHEVWTNDGIYKAELLAAEHFKVPAKKSHLVAVALCQRPDGSDVMHVPDF